MTHERRIKLNGQISEEAAEWFIEFRTGDINATGRRAFDVWVRSSQEHLRAYLEIAAIWNECGALDAQRRWDLDRLILLASENVIPLIGAESQEPDRSRRWGSVSTTERRRMHRRRVGAVAAFAASVLAATVVLWVSFYRLPTYTTEVGEQRSITLSDGSTVELNSRSRVRIHFTPSERRVELLEGQALFQVAKNPARPFVVSSDDMHVRAVGTRFDVNRKSTETVITVVEGKVSVLHQTSADLGTSGRLAHKTLSVRPSDEPSNAPESSDISDLHATILLSAGEQLAVTTQAIPQAVRVNAAAVTAWTNRQLIFEAASLADVVEEFNRYSTRKLVVEDVRGEELRLSGVFETNPEFLIRYLRARPDILVRETDEEILIIRHY